MVKPSLRVGLFDSAGHPVERLSATLDTFVAQTAIDYPMLLRHSLRPGRYRADVTADDRHGHVVRSSFSFQVTAKQVRQVFGSKSPLADPRGSGWLFWALLAGGLALLVAGAGAAWALARRSKRRAVAAALAAVTVPPPPDDRGTYDPTAHDEGVHVYHGDSALPGLGRFRHHGGSASDSI